MTTGKGTAYYRPLEAAMWRASVHRADLELPPWPGEAADAPGWRCWLAAVWAIRPLAEGVSHASPVLAGRIERVLAGRPHTNAQLRRMTISLARYMARVRGRATPFGTFAGAGPLAFGEGTLLRWGEGHRLRVRADAAWLAAVIARLEGCPPLLERLPVVANDLAVARGDRLVVPWQPHLSTAVRNGSEDAVEVSVRLIPVLRTITATARAPIAAGALVDKVAAEHPDAAREALMDVAGQLVASGVLISSLRAPGTCTDPLGHLVRHLEAADAEAVPGAKAAWRELRAIHRQLMALGREGTWSCKRNVVTGRMRALTKTADQPLAVDLRLDATVVLPDSVAGEAAAAAEALIRLSPQPLASASWREYLRDFLTTYGPGVLVPVAELTDPVRGLGYPRRFTDPPAGREVTRRDEALLVIAQEAILDGAGEITLDDGALDRLAPGHGEARRPVTAADVWADLRSPSRAALDRGEFLLGVCGFGRLGAATGRFLDLLHGDNRHKFTAQYSRQRAGVNGALAAQLSFPPRYLHSENVARVAPVLPHVIPLAEHHGEGSGRLLVPDLAVAADTRRLYVVSRSRRRVVEPMLPHASARHTMPPLAWLLFEIPRSIDPAVTAFDWGLAACLPRLPRVRYGRSILAPAKWHLDPSGLPGPQAPAGEWETAVHRLREFRGLPATVQTGDGDRRLRLDLDDPMDLAVLRNHLQSADGPVTVTESPSVADHGWCDGRAHEIIIPLAATAPPDPAPVFLSAAVPPPVAGRRDGDGVVFVKLYGPAEAVEEILVRHLPVLLEQWETPPRWWFVRYRHPVPHLRLRFHDTDVRRAAGALTAWAQGLRRRGLAREISFDDYRPETGRYGTGATMDAAETLFAADTAAVRAQFTFLIVNREIPPQAVTAASLIDLASAVTGSRPAGFRWLLDHPEYADGAPAQDCELRRHTLDFAQDGALQALPGGVGLAAAWAARADAAVGYTAHLTAENSRHTTEGVLGSLLHLHHARAHGIDPAAEATTYKLARSIALSRLARRACQPHDGGVK